MFDVKEIDNAIHYYENGSDVKSKIPLDDIVIKYFNLYNQIGDIDVYPSILKKLQTININNLPIAEIGEIINTAAIKILNIIKNYEENK